MACRNNMQVRERRQSTIMPKPVTRQLSLKKKDEHQQLTNCTNLSPQAGTQTKTIILTIVANAIGNVPKNRLCAGCLIITHQISGYSVYRMTEMIKNETKRPMFRQNTMMER